MAKETGQAFGADQLNLLRRSLKFIVLAQDAYNVGAVTAPDGWKVVASADRPAPGEQGFFARVYEKTGPLAAGESRYVVAFRGTDKIKEMKDLDTSSQILFRKLPGQYNQGLEFVRNFCEKNNVNPADIELTGHSLGGYLGMTIGMTLGVKKVWAFNSPGPSKAIRDELSAKIPGISRPLCCEGLVQVRSRYDVISRWQYPEGRIIDVETTGGNHGAGSLKEGIEAAVSGKPLKPVPIDKRSLSSVFNALSRRLAESADVSKIINKLFGVHDATRKPPDCGGGAGGCKFG